MNENDFVVGVLTYITCLREKKRYSTAKSYQDALRSFKCFCGREEIPYAYINRDTLLRYQSWLLAKGLLVTRYLLICAGFVTSII